MVRSPRREAFRGGRNQGFLETPLGWARANILYDKAERLPEPGSPMEILFLMVWTMRQDIEFQKSRATLQALLSQKGADDKTILKAFEDLRNAFHPFDRVQKKEDEKHQKDALRRWIQHGPVEVQAQIDPNRRKVASRLRRGDKDLAQRKAMEIGGQVVGIDAFQRSRRRPR